MIVLIGTWTLTLSSIEMLLLASVDDLVPFVILVSKGTVARVWRLLLVGALVTQSINQVMIILRTRGGLRLLQRHRRGS